MRRILVTWIFLASMVSGLPTPSVSADAGDIWTIGGGGAVDPTQAGLTQGVGGPAVAAWFPSLSSLAVEPSGGVLVADNQSQVLRIRPDGILEVAAGTTTRGFSGDGGSARAAQLSTPSDLAIDPAGGFVIVDEGNFRIRKVWPNGTITTIAGNGVRTGTIFDGSPATQLPLSPGQVAFAPDGQLWFSNAQVLYRIAADGTLWSEGMLTGTEADLAFDSAGNLFAAMGTTVRRRATNGEWTVVAGSTAPGASAADGIAAAAARLVGVFRLAVAPNGDLLLADANDGRVRRVRGGIITTVAGGGRAADATGCLPATDAASVPANQIAVRPGGSIVVAIGTTIREIAVAGQICPSITSVTPTRVLETRAAEGQVGYRGASPTPGQVVRLSLQSSPIVPATAQAVALNVTITGAVNEGFVTVWPCESAVPNASNVNVTRGGTAANAALVKLGPSRELCVLVQAGGDVLVDVTGFVGLDVPYQAFVPYRALETRVESGQFNYRGDKPTAGQTVRVPLSGFGFGANRVSSLASAVVLNVTATQATADGCVTVWSCEGAPPTASNINVFQGGTVGRMVVAKLGTGTTGFGTLKEVCIFTQSGAHLLVDVLGVFMPDAPYVALAPTRVLETRSEVGQIGYSGARPDAGQVVEVDVVGRSRGGVAPGARSVVLSLTATNPRGPGFVTAWPCGTPRPLASSLNLGGPGDTQSNAVVVGLGTGGRVCLFTQAGTDLIADVNGTFP